MPEEILIEFWGIIPTIVYFVLGGVLFGSGVWLMEKLSPFSIRKELEEDHNVAVGVLMGSGLIALAIVLAAAIK